MGRASVKKACVIVTRRLPDEVEARLCNLFDAYLNKSDQPFTHTQLCDAVKTADILVPTVTDHVDRMVISAAGPSLKLIANFGAGTEHIDVVVAYERGIMVSNTPGVLTQDTADHTLALILATPRLLVEGDRYLRSGQFKGWAPTGILGHRVSGKKLGIIGMGRIGQAVAHRAHAFGLEVHYHNRRPVATAIEQSLSATYWQNLDAMLTAVDIVSVNCPSTSLTRHLLNAQRLACLRPDSYIVNTSRGEIIDESALASALKAGKIAGAGLDVYENEPEVHPDLLNLPNVILTPHIASATHESRQAMGEKVMINIHAVLDGHSCPDRVLPPGATFSKVS